MSYVGRSMIYKQHPIKKKYSMTPFWGVKELNGNYSAFLECLSKNPFFASYWGQIGGHHGSNLLIYQNFFHSVNSDRNLYEMPH